LSRQCNCQSLAVQAARDVRKKHDARFEIHTALQNQACPILTLPRVPHEGSAYLAPGANPGSSMMQVAPAAQRLLPGCE
jgi:hypothetical protein